MKTKKPVMLFLLAGMAMGMSLGVSANDDIDVLQYQQINIEGAYNGKSPGDQIEAYRKKLEKQSEDIVKSKIEKQRIKQEQQLNNNLQNIFSGHGGDLDDHSGKSEKRLDKEHRKGKYKQEHAKIGPLIGVTTLKGENFNYESNLSGGVYVESPLMDYRAGLGLSFNYMGMDITEINPVLYQTYYGVVGNTFERDLDYTLYSIDFYGKYYLSQYSAIRPFVGVGLGYNRSTLKYQDKVNTNSFPQFGNYQREVIYNNSYFSGLLMGGTDVRFSDNFGILVEFRYRKAINAAANQSNQTFVQNVNGDQVFLNELGESIDNSHSAGVSLGVNVYF